MKKVLGMTITVLMCFSFSVYAQTSLTVDDVANGLVELQNKLRKDERDHKEINGPADSQDQEYNLGLMRYVLTLNTNLEPSVIDKKISEMRELLTSRKVKRVGGSVQSVSAPLIREAWEKLANEVKAKAKIDVVSFNPLDSTKVDVSINEMQKSVKKYVDYVNGSEEKSVETEGAEMKESAKNIKCSTDSNLLVVPQAQTDVEKRLAEIELKISDIQKDIGMSTNDRISVAASLAQNKESIKKLTKDVETAQGTADAADTDAKSALNAVNSRATVEEVKDIRERVEGTEKAVISLATGKKDLALAHILKENCKGNDQFFLNTMPRYWDQKKKEEALQKAKNALPDIEDK